MAQDQFQIYGNGVQYQTVQQPDLIPAIDREQARQKQADQEFLEAVRRNNAQKVQNSKLEGQDLIALGKFSQTLVNALVDNQKKQNEEDLATGLEEGYRSYLDGGRDMTDYNQGMQTAKTQDAVASDVEADVQNNSGQNYEASANIGKATTWKQVGQRRGFAMGAVSGYGTFVEQRMAGQVFNSSAEYAAALSDARQQFFQQAGLTGLNPKFMVDSVYPTLQKNDAAMMRKWQTQFAVDDSFARQAEASTTLLATKDVRTYLDAVRSTVGKNGDPLGYAGAWTKFEKELTDGISAGKYSETDIVAMENQPIPGDSKNRTYGELYGTRFGKVRKEAAAQRRKDWNNQETDRKQEFEKAEQELVNSFIDSSDTDGFTDEQIDDAITTLRDTFGMESSELSALKNSTVDAKQREVQEDAIETLVANNLLTTDRLKKFDPKLVKKYLSTAQATDKLIQENGGGMKVQLDAIKDMVEYKAGVTRDSKRHPTVGLMVAQQQQKFNRLVTQYAQGGSKDPVGDAYRQVEQEFEKIKSTANAYANEFAVPKGSVQASLQESRMREIFINDHLMSYGNYSLEMPNTLFSPEALKSMTKGFGSENWTTDPQVDYIASKLGVDPLTVLNKQLIANGMDALPPSPAIEVVNKLTPTQQNLLNKYKTEYRTERGLSGLVAYTPEMVPGGHGQTVASAAQKHNIPPAILAALIETESSWIPGRTSSSGAQGLAQFKPATADEMGVDVNDPASSINGAAAYLRKIMDGYNVTGGPVDLNTALYMYNAGPFVKTGYPNGEENKEYLKKVLRFSSKYGNGRQALSDPAMLRPSLAYISGNIGPTSTGPHLDVKEVGGGRFEEDALDEFVEVDDPEFGRTSLSSIRERTGGIGDNFDEHVARGSHGVDYGLHSGTKVFVKNGAKVIGSQPSEHGDIVTIELPNGKRYTFLHGKKA